MTAHRIPYDEYRMLEVAANRGVDPGSGGTLDLEGYTDVLFLIESGLVYAPAVAGHPNGTRFTVMSKDGNVINVAKNGAQDEKIGVVCSGEALDVVLAPGGDSGSPGWIAAHYE